jgi:bisphosphoglycerate-independent phosphoglycerate mutase (AlkP superfamily)
MALRTKEDLYQGNALSADFTGEGWRRVLDFPDTPVLQPTQAGARMAVLSRAHHFSLFEYWPTDFAGHRQDMEAALGILLTLDQVLAGLLSEWDEDYGLVLITSDHGNMENLHSRRHTENKVPCLVIGSRPNRLHFSQNLTSLTDIYAAVLNYLDD